MQLADESVHVLADPLMQLGLVTAGRKVRDNAAETANELLATTSLTRELVRRRRTTASWSSWPGPSLAFPPPRRAFLRTRGD